MTYSDRRAIVDCIRSEGGRATLHSADLGMDHGDFMRALHELRKSGLIVRVAKCTWEEVRLP